jgi:hypothetical protein
MAGKEMQRLLHYLPTLDSPHGRQFALQILDLMRLALQYSRV